jgi:hypothetical protein
MANPMLRAGIPQSAWLEFAKLPSAQVTRLKAAIGEPVLEQLRSASGLKWISFTVEAALADAAYEVLGAGGARDIYRRKTVSGFDLPLFRPAAQSTLRLFGVTPVSICKTVARTWGLLSRECGEYGVVDEAAHGRGASLVRNWPVSCYRRREAWLESALGGYEGMFEAFKMNVRVRAEHVDPVQGSADFVFGWDPAALPARLDT